MWITCTSSTSSILRRSKPCGCSRSRCDRRPAGAGRGRAGRGATRSAPRGCRQTTAQLSEGRAFRTRPAGQRPRSRRTHRGCAPKEWPSTVGDVRSAQLGARSGARLVHWIALRHTGPTRPVASGSTRAAAQEQESPRATGSVSRLARTLLSFCYVMVPVVALGTLYLLPYRVVRRQVRSASTPPTICGAPTWYMPSGWTRCRRSPCHS